MYAEVRKKYSSLRRQHRTDISPAIFAGQISTISASILWVKLSAVYIYLQGSLICNVVSRWSWKIVCTLVYDSLCSWHCVSFWVRIFSLALPSSFKVFLKRYNSGGSRGRVRGSEGSASPPPIRPDVCLRLKFLHGQDRISLFNWLGFLF